MAVDWHFLKSNMAAATNYKLIKMTIKVKIISFCICARYKHLGYKPRVVSMWNLLEDVWCNLTSILVGETGASCYGGRLLQGRFMKNYNIDGEIADSSCIRIHQGNH